jgi:hypothetical protein
MRADLIEVTVTHSLSRSGCIYPPGTRFRLRPKDAAELLRTRRAKLVDPNDITAVLEAEAANIGDPPKLRGWLTR